jgi:hypothetical protein
MTHRHLEAEVPRLAAIGWLKRSGLWAAAASVTPASLRPLIRRRLMREPGTTRMDPADRRYLVDFYREDIRKIANLLGRNLDAWLRPLRPSFKNEIDTVVARKSDEDPRSECRQR